MSQRASALQSLLALVQHNRRGPQRVTPVAEHMLAVAGDQRQIAVRSVLAPEHVTLRPLQRAAVQTKLQTLQRLLEQVQRAPRRK